MAILQLRADVVTALELSLLAAFHRKPSGYQFGDPYAERVILDVWMCFHLLEKLEDNGIEVKPGPAIVASAVSA